MSGSFADSNVLLYLLSEDERKRQIARSLVAADLVISVQVLNEIANVARRKHGMGWDQIDGFLTELMPLLSVRPLTVETHEAGRLVAARYGFAFYDSLIVAASIEADCTMLFSEDLQHGQQVGNLTITNPFH